MKRNIKSNYKKKTYNTQSNRDKDGSRFFIGNKASETAEEQYFYSILNLEFSLQSNYL